ncbi:uncharacterized protein DNG_02006 [Cephalotrichum gorgonifer]|uniref:Transcription factor tau subunit sfc1 n=1 Tax=Cephalotrichum gorgonifer TaxID=2041049 RepID=A0AAE8SS52_9PEZI|nr:uncharacterized protein DNG_02006 [Cephalotrichum gorgonifer]
MDRNDQQAGENPPGSEEYPDVIHDGPSNNRGQANRGGKEGGAPRYTVPPRAMGAVEIPMIVADVDRAIRAFGNLSGFKAFLDPNKNSLPLYMDPENAFCPSIVSHNASTHNVLLKVTVPKRTGRKKKRGTAGPWQVDPAPTGDGEQVASLNRADHPKVLLRKLQDNVDKYTVETTGVIKHTHRYRGLMDFQVDLGKSEFATNFVDKILSGDIEQMKQFKINHTIDTSANTDIIPPPKFTHMTLPFNYAYEQNPFVHAVKAPSGEEHVVNTTAPSLVGSFIAATDPTPMAPARLPNLMDPLTAEVIAAVEEAFEIRPIWTRRSLLNHLGPRLKNWGPLKRFIGYAAYQFKGGPWRDALMPYGLDPRSHPKYRAYQTLSFKLPSLHADKAVSLGKGSWKSIRRARDAESYKYEEQNANSHIFNGETYFSNGKVWQVCDITDPVLQSMFADAKVRPTCDVESSGWFHQGLWGKAKAVMKCKLVAVLFNRSIPPHAFDHLLLPDEEIGEDGATDTTPPPGAPISLRLPDLGLTSDEIKFLKGRRIRSTGRRKTEKKKYVSVQLTRRPPRSSLAMASTPASVETPRAGEFEAQGAQGAQERPSPAKTTAEPRKEQESERRAVPGEEDEMDEDEDEDVDEEMEEVEDDGQAYYNDPYSYLDDDDGGEYIYDDD